MVEWHCLLNGHEFEHALGVGDEQGSLACCSPRGLQESDMTEHLNNKNNMCLLDSHLTSSLDLSFLFK